MATLRVLCAVAVMIACCVIVYPRCMHHYVLKIFGMSELPKTDADENVYPPHYRTMDPEKTKPQVSSDHSRKSIRSAPHPSMRGAADMQKQPQQGSGRGMMGVVLPMYAIGIILYLMYTLFKVFNKSKNNSWNQQQAQIDGRSGGDKSVDRMGFPMTLNGGGDVRNFLNDQQHKQQLEDLLARIDNKNVSLTEMKDLQKRLEETESQMARILQAMQTVQTNVDNQEKPQAQPSDLSPDIESYEIIDKQGEVDVAKDEEKRNKNEINGKKGETDFQKQGANAEFVKLSCQTGKLHKEVDFDDIDKDSDNEIECMSGDKETQVDSPSEEIVSGMDDARGQAVCPDLGVRQRIRQT